MRSTNCLLKEIRFNFCSPQGDQSIWRGWPFSFLRWVLPLVRQQDIGGYCEAPQFCPQAGLAQRAISPQAWHAGLPNRQISLARLPRPSRTTRPILLDRWTRHRAVRAENATVTRLWFKALAASLAVIEELASVGWHPLNRLVPTLRTSDRKGFDHGT